jgi:FlaG/FlaF family flagellin (archaellin)
LARLIDQEQHMATRFKSGQRGLSFIGLVFVAVVLAATGAVLAQVFPTALEYQAILKASKKAAAEGSAVPEVRAIFDKAASIDNISSISGKDLEVTKVNDKVVVSFAYEREIHLFGPAYLTIKYTGQSR